MKLKMIALAAMLAAGSANAALDNSLSGNGSLFLSVWNGVDTSVTFDLGYNMDSFLPAAMSAAGTSVTWNLGASTVSNNAGLAATPLTYASYWSSFAATVTDWTKVVYDIGAMDSTGTTAGADRYLSTSRDLLATVATQTNTGLLSFSTVDTYLNVNNANGTHATDANGAASFASGDGYYFQGKQAKWKNNAKFTSNDVVGNDLPVYLLATSSTNGLSKASVATYAGEFNLNQAGVLSYSVAAVPEASTYGMMLAGLGLVGFMARRRLSV
ncbi:MAG: PEP-CTERM sorting domain-containing protein [Thiobacillus sp.]|nr:PEP-CTERM sorting domain-containing protein [Thiobacillus sp.]